MAMISPFAAVRYDARRVGGLERVLTQPYDKITPEMQQEYFQRSPYNLAHILKGEVRENDSPADNVYTRAAAHWLSWQEQGILIRRQTPALYAYFQQFSLPEAPGRPPLLRKGFIGLGRLESYDSGVVFRHEQTLSGPKADRLDLLRATRAHFGQIFMLYSDPERNIDRLLEEEAAKPPAARVEDEQGVVHTLWDIETPERIGAIQHHMLDRKLIIADGHHRYETALNFQRECQATRPHEGPSACSQAMMTFINMDSEGMAVLPTHRLVSGLAEFDRAGFLSRAARYFRGREYPFSAPARRAVAQKLRADMASAAAGAPAIAVIFQGWNAFYLLQWREEMDLERLLPDLSPAQRSLEVTVLHRIALRLCLDMDEEAIRDQRFLTYVRDFEQGMETVVQGKAQACFFLNPVRIQQVREIALDGRLLPQKSTDFYPKLLSGLTIYPVES